MQTRGRRRLATALILPLVLLLLAAGASSAADLMVTNGGDDGSPGTLRHVISVAAEGDRIIFQRFMKRIILTGDKLVINKQLTIDASESGHVVIQQTASGKCVFYVTPSAVCTFKALEITGGNLGNRSSDLGAGVLNYGTLTMERCVVTGNTGGGGITNRKSLTMTHCNVSGNSANGSGKAGGIANLDDGYNPSVLTMMSCIVDDNVCIDGYAGGIYNGDRGTLFMNNCKIRNNVRNGFGGGIFIGYDSPMTSLTNGCVVTGNTPDNICTNYGGTYTTDGTCTIGDVSGTSATALSGFAGGASPAPRKTAGEPDVAAVERDLRSPTSELFVVVKNLLESDLGGLPGDVSAGLSSIDATVYNAFAYEDVSLSDATGKGELVIEFTASWPENVRYYAAFAEYGGAAGTQSVKGYVIPERGVQFEIKPGQPLPDGAVPPEFYEEGEGLMTWRNVIADNGPYDHNLEVGVVTFRVASIRAEAQAAPSGSSGCSTGGVSSFALLLGAPLLLLRRIRGRCTWFQEDTSII